MTANKFQSTDICSLGSELQFFITRICFSNNQITIFLKERRSVLENHSHLSNSASKDSIKLATHALGIRLTSVMNTLDILNAELTNKSVDCIDLLAN